LTCRESCQYFDSFDRTCDYMTKCHFFDRCVRRTNCDYFDTFDRECKSERGALQCL
jgi:hypothetical protein